MSDEIPQWALDRAEQEFRIAKGSDLNHWEHWRPAFARYIAAHEEPPVDPLLIEARRVVAHSCGFTSRADAIFAGELDNDPTIRTALAALRRGMELAK